MIRDKETTREEVDALIGKMHAMVNNPGTHKRALKLKALSELLRFLDYNGRHWRDDLAALVDEHRAKVRSKGGETLLEPLDRHASIDYSMRQMILMLDDLQVNLLKYYEKY